MKQILRRILSVCLACCFLLLPLSAAGCAAQQTSDYTPISGLDESQEVTLKIAIPYETDKALNNVANAFMERYPNVSVQLQYVEDYSTNALKLFQDNAVDIILQKDIKYTEYTVKDEASGEDVPTGKTTEDYFYNFAADEGIDFSGTTADISDNYRHTRQDENGTEVAYQYTYPLGGETRGVFVNKTLLESYGLSVPTDYDSFLACCETLKAEGLVPIQGSPDTAAYGLGLAPAANAVVHDEAALANMAAAEPGISAEFEPVLSQLYDLATNRYFDYKAVEETGYFTSGSELGQAQSFLGLQVDPDSFEVIKPENNSGYAAFFPYISSTESVIQNLVDTYELDTDFVFICSPLNDGTSNSPVYITPYYGLSLNKNSDNLIWLREFTNFVLASENNVSYAQDASIIPNTTDALTYVAESYGVDVDTDVTLCGQIRFSDTYNGYTPIASALQSVLKCEAPKYMVNLNRDEAGNIGYQTDENGVPCLLLGNEETVVYEEDLGEEDSATPGYAFCNMNYFLNLMEEAFAKYKVG